MGLLLRGNELQVLFSHFAGNMFNPATVNASKKDNDRVRGWLASALQGRCGSLPDFRYQMVVAETLCTEPDCVPIETVIGVILIESEMNSCIQPRKYTTKVLKPIAEVTEDDLLELDFSFRDTTVHPDVSKCNNLIAALDACISSASDLEAMQMLRAALEKAGKELERRIKVKISEKDVTHVPIALQAQPVLARPAPINAAEQAVRPPVMSAMDNISKLQAPRPSSEEGSRHEKGRRRRGCPCCDPDNLDNIVDKMLFSDSPGI